MKIMGNGVDIIEVRRIKNSIDKYGQAFLKRIFTDRELDKAKEHKSFFQHIAGRFAAKEAVFKALNIATLNFKEVQILNDDRGKPHCSLLNDSQNKFSIYISISHIKNYAVASAIIAQRTNSS